MVLTCPKFAVLSTGLPGSGYLNPEEVRTLLKAAQIPLVEEFTSTDRDELVAFAKRVKFPVVAKVVGPIHKSDMGGVALNIRSEEHLIFEYERMMRLPDVTAVMVQPMLKGQELFLELSMKSVSVMSCFAVWEAFLSKC